MPRTKWFNAHHAPIGAFATFTLGSPGATGGLGLELGKPADENIYIGLETQEPNTFEAFPFYQAALDESARYSMEHATTLAAECPAQVRPFAEDSIDRRFALATDCWSAGDLSVTIYSPVHSIPDPDTADAEEVKAVVLPAVCVEMTVDNSQGTTPRRAFLGYQGSDPYANMRRLQDTTDGTLVGVGQGRRTAIATTAHGSVSGLGFTIEDVLVPRTPENRSSGLGPVAAIVITVPPGTRQTIRLAICFYREGIPTVGMDMRYLYTRYFANIDEVAAYALENFERYVQWAHEADALLMQSSLSADQQFMFAHATRSYYGSTELLEHEGRPFWVVNEGEYRMMNTFDLFVDQLFFEMRMNPWVVRNVLDSFLSRYSYHDQVHFPQSAVSYPGGLSFTHDMGVGNVFSRPGYSAYELYGLAGTFSHMTHEQLVNWVCCAGVYAAQTHDDAWLEQHLDVLGDCLQSLLRRDHPDPAQRNGMMGLDSSRSAAEITTYDSLDTSLGQARNNAYMAVKTWAAYILLARIFAKYGNHEDATLAEIQADRCARTIVSHVTGEGLIPAIMGEENESYIISAIEGLIFPYACGDLDAVSLAGRYGDLIHALREHIDRVLQRGVCLFPDGGWKLSSTSDNSWLSKIYLCQFVARAMLGIRDERSEAVADSAHVAWLLDPRNTYWGWSDQMIAGVATFSKYYPRGVTSVLWLDEAMWADTPVCALPSLSMIAGN